MVRTSRLLGNVSLAVVLLGASAFLLPGLFGYQRYVITGGSMSGTFERGAVAFEKVVPVDRIEVGDVITYLPPADSGVTTLVTHRVVARRPAQDGTLMFRTRGDANEYVDPWRFRLSAAGQPRVAYTLPLIGYPFLALADRSTRVAVIGGPAALVALRNLYQIFRLLRPEPSARVRRTGAVQEA